ncbi:MAG: hypothetical protein POELPBGB_04088 [Bacteroidia bacterium]|nr:hypothetical protein [Bacteroidia bacterium]
MKLLGARIENFLLLRLKLRIRNDAFLPEIIQFEQLGMRIIGLA